MKAVRLRGELSQGIVCLPAQVKDVDLAEAHAAGRDFAADLGVTKWLPPIPVHLSGLMASAPDLLPWIEVENVKRYPDIFQPGEQVVATEKIHGTACLFTLADGVPYVSSKGFGGQRLAIQRDEKNLYWRAIETYGVPAVAERVAAELGAARVGVFGEVFGKGVQDLAYGTSLGYAVFDVAVDVGGTVRWLSPSEVREALAGELPPAPTLYEGGYDVDLLLALAEGRESVSGGAQHLREGLVVRAATERYSPVVGGRAIAKFVADSYLTRKGGTEYE